MARITINDQQFEVEAGRQLVEVIKELGFVISNLCYIDGLPPYAGCRTCAVAIEGQRGLPLACTTQVTDGMAVRTDTAEVKEMRQEVLAIILANHSDRCLTCHRVEHCRTGEICLRDNVVTHRCVTCSKNYRCELQTACDVADVGRANVEPYLDEARTYYQHKQPPPDRNNPYFEFDPQMCIICTRCVRACEDIRHTTAITLAGRGFSTRIAFGSGGTIDESNCDFCGACVDVCPTATLMETPNKWLARPDRWVTTTCTECSMGCTIQLGVKDGRGVIVKPGKGNDVSRDQICVRGRYGYDQIRDKHRLRSGRMGRGEDALDTPNQDVIADAARTLAGIVQQHGAGAVGVLGSGQATNEELFLLRGLAETLGTANRDSSVGATMGPVAEALRAAFGSEHLPSRLTGVECADLVVAIGDDLSSSNNVLGVRIKDAVVKNGATLISVTARHNMVGDFTPDESLELRPADGDLAAAAQAIVAELLKDADVRAGLSEVEGLAGVAAIDEPQAADAARALLAKRGGKVAVIVAPSRHRPAQAAAQVRAAANLAIVLAGPAAAPAALHVLPPEANATGLRDLDIVPGEDGMDVNAMLAAARSGGLKALVVLRDNPLLALPNTAEVQQALNGLECLVVIDEVATDTVGAATHVIADVSAFAKDGSVTNADRQILRLRRAADGQRGAQPAWESLAQLTAQVAAALGAEAPAAYARPAEVMDAIAQADPRYAELAGGLLLRHARQPANGAAAQAFQPVARGSADGDGLVLLTGRDLYTDRLSAAIHLPDADRLGRADALEIHPADAAARNINDGDPVSVRRNGAALSLPVKVTDDVPQGAVWLSLLWNGGAAQTLLRADDVAPRVEVTS